jgi:hypothetical protein
VTLLLHCISSVHYKHSWRIDTEDGVLVSGGNNWLQRQFIISEPHELTLSDDGVLSLTRLSDGKIIDRIVRKQKE